MTDRQSARAARMTNDIAATLIEQYGQQDRDIVCRAFAMAIGSFIAADAATQGARIMIADLYGMHIKAAVRPHVRGHQNMKGWGASAQ